MPSSASDTTITFDLITPSLIASNQEQLIRKIAAEASVLIGINSRILAERLAEQEKQKPSAMGDGAAISHLPISGLKKTINIFCRLKHAIDMDAPDKKPVDLVAVMITPEREGSVYLCGMARLSRLLRDQSICTNIRNAADKKEIRAILEQSSLQQRLAA